MAANILIETSSGLAVAGWAASTWCTCWTMPSPFCCKPPPCINRRKAVALSQAPALILFSRLFVLRRWDYLQLAVAMVVTLLNFLARQRRCHLTFRD
jgi:hypothetical protein